MTFMMVIDSVICIVLNRFMPRPGIIYCPWPRRYIDNTTSRSVTVNKI